MGLSCRIGVLGAAAPLSADFSSDPTGEPDQHRLLFRSHSHQLAPIQPEPSPSWSHFAWSGLAWGRGGGSGVPLFPGSLETKSGLVLQPAQPRNLKRKWAPALAARRRCWPHNISSPHSCSSPSLPNSWRQAFSHLTWDDDIHRTHGWKEAKAILSIVKHSEPYFTNTCHLLMFCLITLQKEHNTMVCCDLGNALTPASHKLYRYLYCLWTYGT